MVIVSIVCNELQHAFGSIIVKSNPQNIIIVEKWNGSNDNFYYNVIIYILYKLTCYVYYVAVHMIFWRTIAMHFVFPHHIHCIVMILIEIF